MLWIYRSSAHVSAITSALRKSDAGSAFAREENAYLGRRATNSSGCWRDRRILHLFDAGFATNVCVPFRDYGMRAFRKRGYNPIFLRDCTTAIEAHDTVDDLLNVRIPTAAQGAGAAHRLCRAAGRYAASPGLRPF